MKPLRYDRNKCQRRDNYKNYQQARGVNQNRASQRFVDAIKNFDEQATVNFIANTFHNNSHDHSIFNAINTNPTFNPIDKVVELYERLLQSEREKVALLQESMKKQ